MTFHLEFPTKDLRPASYNPRAIAPDALEHLQDSIRRVGFCKPIIVTKDSLIIAGHQRTKAARALGIDAVPAWVIERIDLADEVRFNQLHNGTDLDRIDNPVRLPASADLGRFVDVSPDQVTCNRLSEGAVVRQHIMTLLATYGNWGGAVATASGLVLSGQQYVLSCVNLGLPVRAFYVADEHADVASSAFARRYGEFSYGHLPKKDFVQSFAQPFRLRNEETSKQIRSILYESAVIPALQPGERVLDFGCGQADYVRKLRHEGRRVWGIEFFMRTGKAIDSKRAHAMVDAALAEVEQNGPFDVVLADAVINSVNSVEAETDVLTCMSALCRPGGRIYFSTRAAENLEAAMHMTTQAEKRERRYLEFLDNDGFSGLLREGTWFYQKFHRGPEVARLAAKFFGEGFKVWNPKSRLRGRGNYWLAAGLKSKELAPEDVEASLRREFDLQWPAGQRVGRADQAVRAWRAAK